MTTQIKLQPCIIAGKRAVIVLNHADEEDGVIIANATKQLADALCKVLTAYGILAGISTARNIRGSVSLRCKRSGRLFSFYISSECALSESRINREFVSQVEEIAKRLLSEISFQLPASAGAASRTEQAGGSSSVG